MNFFKYIIIIFIFSITQQSYAAYSCGVNADVILTTDLEDYPTVICAVTGVGNCEVIEDHSIRQPNGSWLVYAKSTGEGCLSPTNLDAPPLDPNCTRQANGSITCEDEEEEEEEPETTLSCTSDMCSNPNSLRCPTNYSGGTFNGNRVCIKNNRNPPDDPTEECGDDTECQEAAEHAQIAVAVNNANSSITDKIGQMASNLSNKLGEIADKLGEIGDKIGNLAGGNGNGGNGNGNGNGDGEGDAEGDGNGTDTSGLEADVPFITNEELPQLDENLFGNNAQCPEPKVLSMPFMGSSISYDFEFTEICNSLNYLSYIVMIMSYLISCYIIIRA